MSSLVLEVSAVANASLATVFKSFVSEGQKAAKQVSAAFAGAAQGAAKGAQAGGDVVVAQAARGAKAQTEAARQGTEAVRSASKTQAELIRSVQDQRNREHKQFLGQIDEQTRAAKKSAEEIRVEKRKADQKEALEKRIGSATTRTFGGYMSSGLGVARDVAGAAGVDLSLAGNMRRARALQSEAGDATRSAYTAAGKVATAEDVQRTVDAIRAGGDAAKKSYTDISAGLNTFVAKSADLDTGTKIIADMGMLARATGADVGDLLAAAGDVNRELDDSPDRAERLMSIMRLVAKQGAMGNLEVKDLAKYMGKVSSTAFMYEGDKDANIGILGALAQVSMKGGQSTAPEATRSAAAFARDLTKSAALKRFDEYGINVFANKEKTAIRGPEAIITDFLAKSKGNFADLANLFQNQSSRAVVLGFENIYKQAGGGAKGIEAVRNEFKRFTTTMTADEVNAQAKTSLDSPEARAQAIQNRFETLAAQVMADVLPSLERLAPNAERAAEALAKIVSFGLQNPGTMIVGAIVASIAKAQLQERLGESLSKMIGGIGPKGGLAIGAATIAIAAATIATNKMSEGAGAAREQVQSDEKILTALESEYAKTGTLAPESLVKLKELRDRVKEHKAAGQDAVVNDGSMLGDIGVGARRLGRWISTDQSWDDIGKGVGYNAAMGNVASQEKGIEALLRLVESQKSGVQRVHVENASDLKDSPGGPGVDQGARGGGGVN